ncbi:acyl-CoA dehydrogenase family protein [Streptomyces rubellomurinus]|uniref:Acyl-CoA dehydrogenase family protein n=1 Tax=Streptomyces sp. Y1 TaxID=3238634 RepID=A0AB39TLG2_9ACTN|nr:acyl-CoA dehydrogenase family protein [Streptomyces rubellomurinus]
MHFSYDPLTKELRWRLLVLMDQHLFPAEAEFAGRGGSGAEPWARPDGLGKLRELARERGLWNLFLPHPAFGPGLTNLQYAPLAEISGRSPFVAPDAINGAAPDTGVMNVLAEFGTRAQQDRWLRPLLAGDLRSAVCLPAPGAVDPGDLRIEPRGSGYVLDGHGGLFMAAAVPECALLLVMARSAGRSAGDRSPGAQRSIALVPVGSPGVSLGSGPWSSGYDDGVYGGRTTVRFTGVRLPAHSIVGGEGDGAVIAHSLLDPNRLHHCMRLIGMAERGLDLMSGAAGTAETRGWARQARLRIEQARLLALRTAWLMDTEGGPAAWGGIEDVKAVVPGMTEWVLDRAIRARGDEESPDGFPLARLREHARVLKSAG